MKNKAPTLQDHINDALDLNTAELHMMADNFRQKAADLALDLLLRPDQHGADEKRRLAKDHMIRCEAFRTAANHTKPTAKAATV